MERLSQRLRRLRKERRLSIKEVANRVGIPATTYREWEYGRAIQGEPYPKLAEVLGVTLTELMTGKRPSKVQALKLIAHMEQDILLLKQEVGSFL